MRWKLALACVAAIGIGSGWWTFNQHEKRVAHEEYLRAQARGVHLGGVELAKGKAQDIARSTQPCIVRDITKSQRGIGSISEQALAFDVTCNLGSEGHSFVFITKVDQSHMLFERYKHMNNDGESKARFVYSENGYNEADESAPGNSENPFYYLSPQ